MNVCGFRSGPASGKNHLDGLPVFISNSQPDKPQWCDHEGGSGIWPQGQDDQHAEKEDQTCTAHDVSHRHGVNRLAVQVRALLAIADPGEHDHAPDKYQHDGTHGGKDRKDRHDFGDDKQQQDAAEYTPG